MEINPKYLIRLIIVFVFSILGCKNEPDIGEIIGNVIIKSVEYDINFAFGDTITIEDADSVKIVLFEDIGDSVATTYSVDGIFSFEDVSPGVYYVEARIGENIVEENSPFNVEADQTVSCPDIVFEPYPSLSNFSVRPNPIDSQAYIRFSLLSASYIFLSVYDTKGEQINLIDEPRVAGTHEATWSTPDSSSSLYSSGNYFFSLLIDNTHLYIVNAIKEE